MPDILHQITIDAPAEAVYEALTTQKGLASWWTSDVRAEPREGAVAEFGFRDHTIVFRMRVSQLIPARLVRWECEGDYPEWTGTNLRFELEPGEESGVSLRFTHAGWGTTEGSFATCCTDWGRLMYYLKDHVEGRGTGPMMR